MLCFLRKFLPCQNLILFQTDLYIFKLGTDFQGGIILMKVIEQFIFNKLFSIKKANSQEVVTAFSGLLELSRREKVETEQSELFGDINVKRK